jgi:predicted amidohydrolase
VIKIAAVNWTLREYDNVEEFFEHIEICVKTSKAQIILLPEYFGLQYVWLCASELELANINLDRYLQFFSQLASKYDCVLVPGTFPSLVNGRYYNRAYIISPNGSVDYQDKLMITKDEHAEGLYQPGSECKLFQTKFASVGIAICYDSEFSHITERICDSGAELLLVPSYTDSEHGYYRVRTGAQFAALQNQCVVAVACALGRVACWPALDGIAVGSSAIYTPFEPPFPANGILEQVEYNRPGIASSSVDLSLLKILRENGEVRNFYDRKYAKRFIVA